MAPSGRPVRAGASALYANAKGRSGEPVEIEEDQLPVFWACGVTPQAIAMQAKPPLMITHSPGHMFITDRRHSEYEV